MNKTGRIFRRSIIHRKRIALLLIAATLLGVGQGAVLPVRAAESLSGYSSFTKRPRVVCGLKDHTHNDGCYAEENVLACDLQECESHTHDISCYTLRKKLNCGIEESEGHMHTESCYAEQHIFSCGLEEDENHIHEPSCYITERVLICPLNEQIAHRHTESCYVVDAVCLCGHENDPSHAHTLSCYSLSSLILVCGKIEGNGHQHDAACYKREKVLKCGTSEHKHSSLCYVSGNAFAETEFDWIDSMAPARLNGDWNHDLIEIAKTQLGYAPILVGAVSEGTRYYTRYGDWYCDTDLMYGEWCLMFVSFCLYYAGIDALPYGSGCQGWIGLLDESVYHPYGDGYDPRPGDIVLFTYGRRSFRETNENRIKSNLEPLPEREMCLTAEHVGILVSMSNKAFRTIEGNNGPVGYHNYCFGSADEPGDEELIYGYVSIPQNPHKRTITDKSGFCSVTWDFPILVRPVLSDPSYEEYLRWRECNQSASQFHSLKVSFVESIYSSTPFVPTGVLQYSFRFHSLPEEVCVTFVDEEGAEIIPCTVSGNTVIFSTDRVGAFFFSAA